MAVRALGPGQSQAEKLHQLWRGNGCGRNGPGPLRKQLLNRLTDVVLRDNVAAAQELVEETLLPC